MCVCGYVRRSTLSILGLLLLPPLRVRRPRRRPTAQGPVGDAARPQRMRDGWHDRPKIIVPMVEWASL